MKLKQLMLTALCLASATAALAGKIAVLGPKSSYHEFDQALIDLGWEADLFEDTKPSLENYFKIIDNYDLILISPLLNYYSKIVGKVDMTPVRKYLERGGMLVITDSSYPGIRELFDPVVGGGLAKLATGECTSSQWGVNGWTKNVEPVHPIRSFPNKATHGDSWPHFEAANDAWRVLAVCSEGKPVMLYREVGKGCVVVSTLRHTDPAEIENFRVYGKLRVSGLRAKDLSMTDLKPGPGMVKIELAEEAPKGSSVTFLVENEQNKMVSFSTNIVGKTVELPFDVPYRGKVTGTLSVDTGKGVQKILTRVRDLPPLMKIGPNAYRGILSTKRRLDDVKFPVTLVPATEDLGGAKLVLSVYDCASNKVTSLETEIPTNDLPEVLWVPVPLDKEFYPGGYRIDALMTKPAQKGQRAIRAKSSAAFEILAPRIAQTIIDEDGTFLVNGKPFFPLGIYHTRNDSFQTIADMGFNAVQFWRWQVWDDGYGSPRGLDMAQAYGLKCLFESNHGGRGPLTQCVTYYRDHPALLMWYVGDEPHEASYASLDMNNSIWHDNDKNHPTYICSCRPDLTREHMRYSDVFAFDHYGIPNKTLERLYVLEDVVAPHKSPVTVNWAAEGKGLQYLRPSAYMAIVHNVRGIFWYCWNQVGGGPVGEGIHDNPEVIPTYKELLSEFHYMMPGLLSTTRRAFEEGEVHGIALGAPNANGKRYLVTINTATNEVVADFVVPELRRVKKAYQPFLPKVERLGKDGKPVKNKKGEVIMDERPIELEKGRISRTYKPWETYVLRW